MSCAQEMTTALVERVCLDKLRVATRRHLGREPFLANHMDLSVHLDHAVNSMVLELRSVVLARKEDRVDIEERWPADWWQAVKARWLPAWLLRRYPVQYRTICVHKQIYRICPHLDLATPPGPQVHFDYLVHGTETPPQWPTS